MLNKSICDNLKNLYDITLRPLNCSFGIVKKLDEKRSLRSVAKRQARKAKSDVSIVFAVRRPGCSFCRETAAELSALAHQEDVALSAIVKEVGVDDEALATFYSDYFHHAIYQDEKWAVYNALGNRKVNPMTLVKGLLSAGKRHESKKIHNKAGAGDGWTMGGILIFDRKGKLQYAYEEQFGEEVDMIAVRAAVAAVRASHSGYGSDDDLSLDGASVDGISVDGISVGSS